MAQAKEVETDEFAAAAAGEEYVAGYFATADAEIEDQREYRMIPKGTKNVKLGVVSFALDTGKDGKAAPKIACKVEVHEPAEYADGSSNFTWKGSLNPTVGAGKKMSGFDMTAQTLAYLYAAANQVSAAEGKEVMVRKVLAEFQGMTKDDVPSFQLALVENANEQLKGAIIPIKSISVDQGQAVIRDGKPVINEDGTPRFYGDRQSFGTFDIPKAEVK